LEKQPRIMPEAFDRHVFVYGTLRRGESNDINRLQPRPVFVGTARVAGTLYDLGDYPGAVLGGDGVLVGEVYRITSAHEQWLDELEEVAPVPTGEYSRRQLPVKLDGVPDQALDCLAYEIAPWRVQGRAVITGGDWCARRRG
jgi:gamma-glutamylcyclotransferase (GGCT)/AIG2-like uncharacterized protein YtfP